MQDYWKNIALNLSKINNILSVELILKIKFLLNVDDLIKSNSKKDVDKVIKGNDIVIRTPPQLRELKILFKTYMLMITQLLIQ